MRTLFFFISLAIYLGTFPVPLKAQTEPQELTVRVNASVTSNIELVTLQSINISKRDADNGVIIINPLSSANAGKMIALGNPSSNIRIRYLRRLELTHVESGTVLFFNYEVAGNNLDNQTSAELLEPESRELRLNENGQFYLWIGGSIDITNAVPGNYRGEFTLEIEYI